jgi:hypothetical protein
MSGFMIVLAVYYKSYYQWDIEYWWLGMPGMEAALMSGSLAAGERFFPWFGEAEFG